MALAVESHRSGRSKARSPDQSRSSRSRDRPAKRSWSPPWSVQRSGHFVLDQFTHGLAALDHGDELAIGEADHALSLVSEQLGVFCPTRWAQAGHLLRIDHDLVHVDAMEHDQDDRDAQLHALGVPTKKPASFGSRLTDREIRHGSVCKMRSDQTTT